MIIEENSGIHAAIDTWPKTASDACKTETQFVPIGLLGDGILRASIAIAPAIIPGLTCFGLSAIVWLLVLSNVSLSTAYAFIAFGIAIAVAAVNSYLTIQQTLPNDAA